MHISTHARFNLVRFVICVAFTLSQRPASAATINSLWTSAIAGSWNTATNWTPQQVPSNGANSFNVTLAGSGTTGPTVATTARTITSLSVPSPSSLTISAAFTTGAATFGSSPNPTMQPDGSLNVSNTITASLGTLANYSSATQTLTDGDYTVSGILKFTGARIVTNAASITLGTNGAIRNQANDVDALASSFAANASAGTFDLVNRSFTTAGSFTNGGSLFLEAGPGALTSAFTVPSGSSLTNFASNTLTGGTYFIAAYSSASTAKLAFPNANIVTNQADISLWGTNSQIVNQTTGLKTLDNSLSVNGQSGSLDLTGRTLVTAASFTNNGSITLTADYVGLSTFPGVLTIPTNGTLTNYAANTLTGGAYYIGYDCSLKFPGANIVTNAADLTIEGNGAVINNTNSMQPNGLLNIAANAAGGSFSIVSAVLPVAGNFNNAGTLALYGATLQIVNSLTNTGQIQIFSFAGDTNSLLAAAGSANFSGSTLTGGSFLISAETGVNSTLQFPAANIVTNSANISLIGPGASIRNSTGNSDALANLANNSSSGVLSISNGKTITLKSAFNNAGMVTVGAASTFTVPTGNAYTQTGGVTILAGGTLSASTVSGVGGQIKGSGNIVGNIATPGTSLSVSIRGLTPGANDGQYDQINVTGTVVVGGNLNVSLASGIAGTLLPANTFVILTASGPLSGAFNNAQNGSRITTSDRAGSFLVTMTGNSIVLSDFYPTLGLNAWKTAPGMFSSTELADPNFTSADPDQDGLTNMMEYGFYRQPHTNDSGGAVQGGIYSDGSGKYLKIAFTRFKAASDITCQVEVSYDLQTWNFGPPFTSFLSRVDQGATELITWRDNTAIAGSDKRFIRLKLIGP